MQIPLPYTAFITLIVKATMLVIALDAALDVRPRKRPQPAALPAARLAALTQPGAGWAERTPPGRANAPVVIARHS